MRRLIVPVVSCALLFGVYLGRAQLLPAVAKWLNVGEQPTPSDYVVPLPGNPQTRPFVAAALINAGLAREVLVIRTMSYPENDDGLEPFAHELTRRVLEHRGVAPSRIHILPSQSGSTFNDAEAIANFLAGHEAQTMTVVTSNSHTRRARWIFEQVLGNTGHRLHWVAVPEDDFDEDHWWQTSDGLAMYFSEYAKLAYYHFRYAPVWTCFVCAIPTAIAAWALLRWRRCRICAQHRPQTASRK